MKKTLFAVAVMSLTLPATSAHANLKLSEFFVDLHEEGRTDSIYAENQGTDVMFLKVRVIEVINPGADNQETREIADPQELGLLVSPQRLVVQPGEEGRIRMVALSEPEQDRFYKITVEPVVGELQSEQQIGVKILVGYSAWAFVRPQGAAPQVTGNRQGSTLTLTNNGGTLAQMMAGKQCRADGQCENIEPFRVLAGRTKAIELPFDDAPVSFRITWGDQGETVEY